MTLYTIGCPKCKVLKEKLDRKGVKYDINEDVDYMMQRGISQAPMLEKDGELLDFSAAIKYLNSLEEK